jgi:hypothetical protein
VLQNKKYIKFAEENTVEVLALGRLDEGIEKKDRRAETYKGKNEKGEEVDFLVEWPNLTPELVKSLASSKAGSYNNTGKIPYTSIVNPHTLEEMDKIQGGYGMGTLTDMVEVAKKALNSQYGKSLSRKDLTKVNKLCADVHECLGEGDFVKAFAGLKTLDKTVDKAPDSLKDLAKKANDEAIEAAGKKLDEIEGMIADNPKDAAKILGTLTRVLKGTSLEERATDLAEKAKGGPAPE